MAERKYDERADIWSFGIVVWEVCAKQLPYRGLDPVQIARRVVIDRTPLPTPPGAPETLVSVMRSCLTYDVSARPSFESLLRVLESYFEAVQAQQRAAASSSLASGGSPPSAGSTVRSSRSRK
jgi:serine/threonine protein kinase